MTKITVNKDKNDEVYMEVSSNAVSFHRITRNFPGTIFLLLLSCLSFLMLIAISFVVGILLVVFCSTLNLLVLAVFILFLAGPVICGAFSLWTLSMALPHHALLRFDDGEFFYSTWPWCKKDRKLIQCRIIISRVYSRGNYGIAVTLNYPTGLAMFFLQDHFLLEPIMLGELRTSRKMAYNIKTSIEHYFPELMVEVRL